MAMRNYGAMAPSKLKASIKDLERGYGPHYDIALTEHNEYSINQHIVIARAVAKKKGIFGAPIPPDPKFSYTIENPCRCDPSKEFHEGCFDCILELYP